MESLNSSPAFILAQSQAENGYTLFLELLVSIIWG